MSKNSKVCPNCGRKMKQQFIGLQMRYKLETGYRIPVILNVQTI